MGHCQSKVVHWPTMTGEIRHEFCKTPETVGWRSRLTSDRAKVTCSICSKRLKRQDAGLPVILQPKRPPKGQTQAIKMARIRDQMKQQGIVDV